MTTKKKLSTFGRLYHNNVNHAEQNSPRMLFPSSDESQAILARIAHEISNSFTFINSNVQLMGGHNPELKGTDSWKQLEYDIQDITNFLHDFSTYVYSDQLFLDDVNITELYKGIVDDSTEKALAKNISLTFLIGDPSYLCLTHYLCDREKMKLAFTKVVNWIIETTDANSTIHIKLPSSMDDFHVHNNSVQFMKLQITSDGMTQFTNLEEAVYQPVSDNKCICTNLSMAIVHRILQAHKGGILFESSESISTAIIYLPV